MNKIKSNSIKKDRIILAIIIITAITTFYYNITSYSYNYATGDAYDILLRSLYFKNNQYNLIIHDYLNAWDQPIYIPVVFSFISTIFKIPLEKVPLFITPLISIIGIIFFTKIIREISGLSVALLSCILLVLTPIYALMSTEPLKAPYVITFFIISLYFFYKSEKSEKYLIGAGLFLAFAIFSYPITAIPFIFVYAISYVARYGLRKIYNKYFIISLFIILISLLFCIIFAKSNSYGGINQNVERISSSLIYIFQGHFENMAGMRFISATKHQISSPLFYLGFVGILLGLYMIIIKGREKMTPLMLWFFVISLVFALQFYSFSTEDRYTFYIIPPLLFFVSYFTNKILIHFKQKNKVIVALMILIVVIYPVINFAQTSYPSYFRSNMELHKDVGIYLANNNLPEEGKIMYVGWPSITYYLFNNSIKEDKIVTFGWGRYNLDNIDKNFIKRNNVTYYLYLQGWSDYYNSSDIIFDRLKEMDLNLVKVKMFVDNNNFNKRIILYKIEKGVQYEE